jgi:glutathione-regulated potassium-efflux system ancillary protein KefG
LKTLVVVGHPHIAYSRVNKAWMSALHGREGVTVKNLAALYPAYAFDVAREQADLIAHDRIVLQFPLFWYSCPAILKKWIDDVFLPGFAYARGGDKLTGKEFMLSISVGAPAEGYKAGGFNNFTVDELLRPFQQAANYVKARYVPPFLFYRSVFASDEQIRRSTDDMLAYVLGKLDAPDAIYERLLLEAEQMQIALVS